MRSKLTITIKKEIIEKAKDFAQKSNLSLSEIIENYLDKIVNPKVEDKDFELDKILGIIEIPKEHELKNTIREIANKKHS